MSGKTDGEPLSLSLATYLLGAAVIIPSMIAMAFSLIAVAFIFL
ncbi:hypothetical protein [Devosia naphthalenivorans]|nr:hypothetical protein [Devosia naphthalenivorans]